MQACRRATGKHGSEDSAASPTESPIEVAVGLRSSDEMLALRRDYVPLQHIIGGQTVLAA